MSTAPHPAFRRIWIEAAAAGRAMRKMSSLQSAWNSVMEPTLDLLILDSEELLQPLIEFDAFRLPIDEALARIEAERDSNRHLESVATNQPHFSSSGGDAHRDQTKRSLPFAGEPTLTRLTRSGFSSRIASARTSNNPAATQQTKTETLSAIARLVESHKQGAADDSRPGGSVPRLGTVPTVDNSVHRDVREVERQIRTSISNNPSEITRESAATDVRQLDRDSAASVETAASRSSFISISQEPARASLDADAARVAGKKRVGDEQATHGDLFEKVLGGAVERVRSRRQQQVPEEPISSEAVSRERESVLQKDPPQTQQNFPRTGLQRLAARALQIAGAPAEEIRSPGEREFAAFSPAQSFSGMESVEFALHLRMLLHQEMARHGISLEDLEQ
ncbi:MAG TPA: hypothetical protein VKC61_18970 [Pyrinomonadaceae bacterium]|nr:hypothetical protein [Pyrinomonadaceae bacterium]